MVLSPARARPVTSDKPDPSTFPQPNSWATWTASRSPRFKNHKTLGMAKAALTNGMRGRNRYDWWIFRLIEGEWVEYVHLPAGWDHSHPLWTDPKHGPKGKPVSERAVDKAIASIMNVGK